MAHNARSLFTGKASCKLLVLFGEPVPLLDLPDCSRSPAEMAVNLKAAKALGLIDFGVDEQIELGICDQILTRRGGGNPA